MYKYTILTFIFGDYECLREVEEIEEDVEYVCVTDNINLTSNTWKIIVDNDLDGKGVFDKCFSVRYNPFKYASTEICVRIDGSIQLHKSITPIVNKFIESESDVCFSIHPYRDNIALEYQVWNYFRDFPRERAINHLKLFNRIGYDFNKKGFIQLNFSIVKKSKINDDLNCLTYTFQKILGDENDVDRIDQTTISVILDRFFPNIKIFTVSEALLHSKYMTWNSHGTNNEIAFNFDCMIKEPHLNGVPVIYNDLELLY